MKRTRVIYGSDVSKKYIDDISFSLLQDVFQLPPSEIKNVNDIVCFFLNSNQLSFGKEENRYCMIYEDSSNISTLEELNIIETKTYLSDRYMTNRSIFDRITIIKEEVEFNSKLVKPNAKYFNVDCFTDRKEYNILAWGYNVKIHTSKIWSCPKIDPNKVSSKNVHFDKHKYFIELIIDDHFVDDKTILKIVHANFPQLFRHLTFRQI